MNQKLLYENPLCTQEDVRDFVLEGHASLDFSQGCLQMENTLDNAQGQKANYVLWCPHTFPSNLRIEWEFRPVTENGLCILFFAAQGKEGQDLFHASLQPRTGEYQQYHSGDMNAFHISYFRRKEIEERAFHTCNLRKSCGFHLVAQGADPLPSAADAQGFYRIAAEKFNDTVRFFVNELCIFSYEDDGLAYGARLEGGKIGFRQLAPLRAQYKNLKVYELWQ